MTYPCEDYMERHNIQISYIKSINSGCVFFKYKGFFDQIAEWHLLTINWKEPTWHPGAYYIRTYKPVHDGYKNKLFAQSMSEFSATVMTLDVMLLTLILPTSIAPAVVPIYIIAFAYTFPNAPADTVSNGIDLAPRPMVALLTRQAKRVGGL